MEFSLRAAVHFQITRLDILLKSVQGVLQVFLNRERARDESTVQWFVARWRWLFYQWEITMFMRTYYHRGSVGEGRTRLRARHDLVKRQGRLQGSHWLGP